MSGAKIWSCKIGEVPAVPHGADLPLRHAVAAAYRRLTSAEPVFLFSGWGADLTESERAVVENREPLAEKGELASLRAEVERLRGALEQIANHPHNVYPNTSDDGSYKIGVTDGHRCAATVARAALAGGPRE